MAPLIFALALACFVGFVLGYAVCYLVIFRRPVQVAPAEEPQVVGEPADEPQVVDDPAAEAPAKEPQVVGESPTPRLILYFHWSVDRKRFFISRRFLGLFY